ncbi:MAG: BRCT domain-containing protein [Bacteroidaceae bacterium]|jgi:hypothetical protein|nr:BRCT domain-containing protein [Bacteroidaceae bacterium]
MQYGLFTDEDFRQTTPFTDRVVCVLGNLGASPASVRKRILDFGASEVRTSVSRGAHYIVMGNDVPDSQLSVLAELNFNGYYPKVLHRAELDDIFAGHYAAYQVPAETLKSLNLSIQHYNRLKVQLTPGVNTLYTKEMYVPFHTQTDPSALYQQLGNMGIYANSYIDDTTGLLLLPDSTLSHLREGTADETVLYIQNTYNSMRAQNFTFQLIAESDILTWIKSFG